MSDTKKYSADWADNDASKKNTDSKTKDTAGNYNLVSSNIRVQTKLTVGAPNDPFEKEADAMADKVMRMPEQNFVQRKCAHCEEEEKKQVQRKPLSAGITPFIQTKSDGETAVSDSLSNKISSSQGSGNSMDSHTQSFMSSRFGSDFSGVKIHTDAEAIQMNRDLNAKAFTTGSDIYFNEGQYQPHSDSGKQLLAHELVHTVQQTKSRPAVQRAPNEYGTYISTQGPKDFLDGAKGYFANWNYPNIKNVNSMEDVVKDLAKSKADIEKFRIVSHANAFIMDIGLLNDFSPIGFGEKETEFTNEQRFSTFVAESKLMDDATYSAWMELLLKDATTQPLLKTMGITAEPAAASKEAILTRAILEEVFVSVAELKSGGKPSFPFIGVINTFNNSRINSYSNSIKAGIAIAADKTAFQKAVTSLRSNAQSVIKAAGQKTTFDTQADADTFGDFLSVNKKFNPELNAAIREGTGGSSYLKNLANAKAHIHSNTHVEIRGCNAGDRPSLLDGMRNYFGNAGDLPSISAPDLFQYYYKLPFQTFTPNPASVKAMQDLWTADPSFGKNYNLYHRIQNREVVTVAEDTKLDEVIKRYGITLTTDEVKELNPEIKDINALTTGGIIWLKARKIPVDATTTSLDDFCDRNFGNSYKWPQIWANNPSIIKPDKLVPGQIIEVVSSDLSAKTGYIAAELTQADYEKNINAGEAYMFIESGTQPRVIMDDAKRNATMAKWLASKHYGYKDESDAELMKKLKARGGDAYFRSRYISFLSKTYPNIEDPILPDDPRYNGHIIQRP